MEKQPGLLIKATLRSALLQNVDYVDLFFSTLGVFLDIPQIVVSLLEALTAANVNVFFIPSFIRSLISTSDNALLKIAEVFLKSRGNILADEMQMLG